MKNFFVIFFTILFFTVNVVARESVFIPWEFEKYAEADMRSSVVGRLTPQDIFIAEQGENNWIKTETGWVNLRHTPAVNSLEEFFSPMGRNISVMYKNLDTGFTYIHNPDRVLFGASISKLTHALYVYTLAERGVIDIYEKHTYTSRNEWGGTGVLRFPPYHFGMEFTTRELLGYSIRESDNAAFRMLVQMTANVTPSYRDFVTEIGADTRMIRDIYAQNTHAKDTGLFMHEIFKYIEGENLFSHYLKFDLLNTAQTSHPHFTRWEGSNGVGGIIDISMIKSDYPLARKYGWAGGAFHDAGIIYAPSPYMLIILSNMERGAHDIFEDISWFIQSFNHRTFVAPTLLNAPMKGPDVCNGQSAALFATDSFRLTVPVFAEDILFI
jgi:beta-lactamase class A